MENRGGGEAHREGGRRRASRKPGRRGIAAGEGDRQRGVEIAREREESS
jgi:hypothetical protein